MIAMISSAVVVGVEGRPVSVEVHVSNGLPGFTVVGLPDAAVRESRDRVRAALLSSGLTWPLRRVTVNLAPSGMKKTGAGLDLPIAVGVLDVLCASHDERTGIAAQTTDEVPLAGASLLAPDGSPGPAEAWLVTVRDFTIAVMVEQMRADLAALECEFESV